MKLVTKAQHAVTALLDVAENGSRQPVALHAISNRTDISHAYLEQLFRRMREANIVVAARGPGGGYMLAKPPKDITVSDVVKAVDGDGLDGAGSDPVFSKAHVVVMAFFSQCSLAALVEQKTT